MKPIRIIGYRKPLHGKLRLRKVKIVRQALRTKRKWIPAWRRWHRHVRHKTVIGTGKTSLGRDREYRHERKKTEYGHMKNFNKESRSVGTVSTK